MIVLLLVLLMLYGCPRRLAAQVLAVADNVAAKTNTPGIHHHLVPLILWLLLLLFVNGYLQILQCFLQSCLTCCQALQRCSERSSTLCLCFCRCCS